MPDEIPLYPFEIIVQGTPVSLQASARGKTAWKEKISEIARKQKQKLDELDYLYHQPLSAKIYYFSEGEVQGDVDNIIKPILDSLKNIAFCDDKNVESIDVIKVELRDAWIFSDPSEMLSQAINTIPPLVYIRIDADLSWRRV